MSRSRTCRRTRVVLQLLLPLGILLGTGCIRLSGPEDLRRELSRESGVEFEKEMALTVTRSGMWIARMVAKRAIGDEEMISLKGVRRVEVGVYEVVGLKEGFVQPGPVLFEEPPGWNTLVSIEDGIENVFVMTRQDEGRIRGLLVVVTEDDEWVLVRMKGKLDLILEDAIRMAFAETVRPELYAATRAERGLEPQPSVEVEGIPGL